MRAVRAGALLGVVLLEAGLVAVGPAVPAAGDIDHDGMDEVVVSSSTLPGRDLLDPDLQVTTAVAPAGPVPGDTTTTQPLPDLKAGATHTATRVKSNADLRVTVADAPDPMVPFSALTYIVTVHNLGPMAAAGDILPSQVKHLGASATQGACTGSTGTVDCALGTVDAGVTATITISGLVTAPAGTMLTNTATTRICAFVIGSSCVLGG